MTEKSCICNTMPVCLYARTRALTGVCVRSEYSPEFTWVAMRACHRRGSHPTTHVCVCVCVCVCAGDLKFIQKTPEFAWVAQWAHHRRGNQLPLREDRVAADSGSTIAEWSARRVTDTHHGSPFLKWEKREREMSKYFRYWLAGESLFWSGKREEEKRASVKYHFRYWYEHVKNFFFFFFFFFNY